MGGRGPNSAYSATRNTRVLLEGMRESGGEFLQYGISDGEIVNDRYYDALDAAEEMDRPTLVYEPGASEARVVKVPASSVDVDDVLFVGAHGRKPRGNGTWFFTTTRYAELNDPDSTFQTSGTFAQAKKAAQRWAGERGHRHIYVES